MLGGLDYHSIGLRVKAWLTALANTPLVKGDLWTSDGSVNRSLAVGSDGKSLQADSSQTTGMVYIDNPGRENKLINPNFLIDQINEGTLYTVNTTDVRTVDGWSGDAVGTGVFKVRRLADPDNAALMCAEISCTTADAAIGATDRYEFWTAIEGSDLTSFQLGLASAQSFVYQFKLKSNAVTGIFGVYFTNSAGNRFYAGTINVVDTAEHEYNIPLTGDLTGTWLYTNGIGMRMGLVLAAGSNFQGTAGAWTASTVRTTAAQANFMSVNTNIIYLKRGHLIPGALVQTYKPADLQRELTKCQRYYHKTYDQGVAPGSVSAPGKLFTRAHPNLFYWFDWRFKVTMRADPTTAIYSPVSGTSGNVRNESSSADVSITNWTTVGMDGAYADGSGGLASSGQIATAHGTANARLS